ncbi:hypothetical protein CHLRE_09g401145v5 [Chlamydomonas reinhardtii]|uniref:Endonuclease/exonuclease/phosphatase domain-containing protein n=1 Tax=Chlamydomonas reinhardtii TaxID=3055 RepID=A0A2K3DEZ7_CHLRE|nr:uncharacterized protein CHLRE_09g401145v5 [Chlamydomonas reinhardtii]PNW79113.1 hypothetical protein CHLRE_09g401145v5 [Chlamydomonas reinhardtii]
MAPLQVLTLNCWGLWLLSKKRYNRILHLAEFLANDGKEKHELDIVLLQEVWCDCDVDVLISAAKLSGLTHATHYRSGIFGSGLLTLSRYPITETDFHLYMAAGDPASIGCGDYYAAKGVGYARVSAPSGPLDVFNTHLHANYHHTYDKPAGPHDVPAPCTDDFAAFRMAQILELARYVNTTSRASGAAGVVLGGDLNSKPGTLEQEVLRALLPQLRDSWSETHAPGEAGYTCKAPGNTFPPRRQPPERIDYVLTTLGVAACDIKLEHTSEGHSYSDHVAVRAQLRLPAPGAPAAAPPPAPAPARRLALLAAAERVVGGGLERAAQASSGHIMFSAIMAVQAIGFCFFAQLMALLGKSLHPHATFAPPLAAIVCAAGAAIFFVMGVAADGGQARALQQATQQLGVMVEAAGGRPGRVVTAGLGGSGSEAAGAAGAGDGVREEGAEGGKGTAGAGSKKKK